MRAHEKQKMKLKRTLLWTALTLAVLGGLAYANRMTILQYSLGWYTDIVNPRGPYQPTSWQAGPAEPGQPVGKRPPNIIVILADDLGINDLSMNGGHDGITTPNIDALAKAGASFDNGYAGSAVCTVSRAALITGRYPWRFGVEFTPTPGAMARVAVKLYDSDPPPLIDQRLASQAKPLNELGMPGSEVTLAERLKPQGYHNVHIGKWHLGSTPEMRPNAQGFDETIFMESGLYLPKKHPDSVNAYLDFDPIDRFLWPNMRFGVSYNGGKWFEPNKYLTDYFTDEAVNAIRANRNRPFFMYLAHWGVHTPLQATKADYDAMAHIPDHRRRVYGAMVRSVDRSVGRVMQALREEGLDRDTLVIFSSDNGAPGYTGIPETNRPYRGWKLSFFEGGIRVPFIAHWPARIAAGTRHQAPAHHTDIVPTAMAAAGLTPPSAPAVDGVDLLAQLKNPKPPGRPLFWRDGDYRAMQEDGWKLISASRPRKDFLFHLTQDPTERRNLAQEQPQRLADLKAKLAQHHQGMPTPLWPSFIEVPIFIDKTLEQPRTRDDEHVFWIN